MIFHIVISLAAFVAAAWAAQPHQEPVRRMSTKRHQLNEFNDRVSPIRREDLTALVDISSRLQQTVQGFADHASQAGSTTSTVATQWQAYHGQTTLGNVATTIKGDSTAYTSEAAGLAQSSRSLLQIDAGADLESVARHLARLAGDLGTFESHASSKLGDGASTVQNYQASLTCSISLCTSLNGLAVQAVTATTTAANQAQTIANGARLLQADIESGFLGKSLAETNRVQVLHKFFLRLKNVADDADASMIALAGTMTNLCNQLRQTVASSSLIQTFGGNLASELETTASTCSAGYNIQSGR